MLLIDPLNGILGQVSKVKILRFLINSQVQLNGREIAKNTGLSHVKAHIALKELSRHGVVNMRSVGRSLIYWLNEEHILVKEILRPMFEKESKSLQLISKIIFKTSKTPLPLAIILFGSFAKKDASPDSDIDILLVYPKHKKKAAAIQELAQADRKITLLFGNHLAAIPIKIEEFKSRFRKNERFIGEIVRTGKVISGKNIAEIIRYERERD